MPFEPSDLLFIMIVLWIAYELITGSGGGGRRGRLPVAT
jgi:hypothetical protein